jgi:hypothetical protein
MAPPIFMLVASDENVEQVADRGGFGRMVEPGAGLARRRLRFGTLGVRLLCPQFPACLGFHTAGLGGHCAVLAGGLRRRVGSATNGLCLVQGGLWVAGNLRGIDADFTADSVTAAIRSGFEFEACATAGEMPGRCLVGGLMSTYRPIAGPKLLQLAFLLGAEV